MAYNHTLQTAAAFERIWESITGKTSDDLNEIVDNLEFLLISAKRIKDICNSDDLGDSFLRKDEICSYCNLPN